jgi:5-methylthioadenosine/S-adenosylhomocysteine deaminase
MKRPADRTLHLRGCQCCSVGSTDHGRRGLLLGLAASAILGTVATSSRPATAAIGARELPKGNEYLVQGAYILAVDGMPDIVHGDIHVRNGRIAAIGPNLNVPGVDVIDASEMIAVPGFVETHWHMWNTTLKGMIRKGAEYFPLKQAFVRHFTPDDFYVANRLALAEAIHAGMTTVHNFSHNTRSAAHVDAELRALQESGLSGRYSYGWIDPIPDGEIQQEADIARVKREWFGRSSPFEGRVDLGVAVRGPMYTPRNVYEAEINAARTLGCPVVMHIGQNKRRYSSCALLKEEGLLDRSMILVHGQVQSERDRDAIAEVGASVSVSMQSELRGQEDGDIREQLLQMRAKKINLCCSIDSDALGIPSMFDNMSIIWNLGIPWRGTPSEKLPAFDFRQVLDMGTINGARALGSDQRVGSLKAGKQADIVLIRATDLNMIPVGEVDGTVVRHANPSNIDTVIANGKVLKRGGELVGIDLKALRTDVTRSLQSLRQKAGAAWAPASSAPRF